jgi:hypothetical protein
MTGCFPLKKPSNYRGFTFSGSRELGQQFGNQFLEIGNMNGVFEYSRTQGAAGWFKAKKGALIRARLESLTGDLGTGTQ